MSDNSHLSWRAAPAEAPLVAALSALGWTLTELPTQTWDPATSTVAGLRDTTLATLAPKLDAWSFMLLPLRSELGPALAARLSKQVSSPVAVFLEYDQAAWGFEIYEGGHQFARFRNDPEVVGESAFASPETLAHKFGVAVETVAPYLHPITDDLDPHQRAFEDDEFTLDDHWVRCDFMRRLGMDYPDPGAAGTRYVALDKLVPR